MGNNVLVISTIKISFLMGVLALISYNAMDLSPAPLAMISHSTGLNFTKFTVSDPHSKLFMGSFLLGTFEFYQKNFKQSKKGNLAWSQMSSFTPTVANICFVL